MKKAVRILLITLGICAGIILLVVLPLLTHNWTFTAFVGILIGIVSFFFALFILIGWAWSKD